MAPTTQAQRGAVTQFMSFTGADKRIAERVLKAHGWNVQHAVNGFFSSPNSTAIPPATSSALNKLFDKYRDDPTHNPDTITIQGTMSYFQELDIALDHVSTLVISQLLSCPSIGEITREGFVSGWAASGSTTLAAQQTLIARLTAQLATPEARTTRDALFPRVYKHTFAMSLAPPKRSLDLADAIVYWRLLLQPPGVAWGSADASQGGAVVCSAPVMTDDSTTNSRSGSSNGGGSDEAKPWLDWYIEFLEAEWKRAVNRDVWEQTRVFAERCLADASLSWWSEEASWPSVIDEFVGWVRTKKGVGGGEKVKGRGVDGLEGDEDAMDVE